MPDVAPVARAVHGVDPVHVSTAPTTATDADASGVAEVLAAVRPS